MKFGFDIPTPAWAVIHGSLRYKITPQMFSMQRIYEKTSTKDLGESQTLQVTGATPRIRVPDSLFCWDIVRQEPHESYNQAYHDTLYPAKSSRFRRRSVFLFVLGAVSLSVHPSTCGLLVQRRSGVILARETKANYHHCGQDLQILTLTFNFCASYDNPCLASFYSSTIEFGSSI